MPKGRHLKPTFFTDKHVVAVSPLARLLYQGLWCYAADCGHLDDEPIELKMRILPADSCDVNELLEELVREHRISREDGQITVPTLGDHGRIDKRYETICDRCKALREHDVQGTPETHKHDVDTTGTHSDHVVTTMGTRSDHVVDGDGDGDGDKKTSSSSADRAKRGTRLTEDWRPSTEVRDDLAAKLPQVDQTEEFWNFQDYWMSKTGKDATKVDWDRTYRRWIRTAAERTPTRTNHDDGPKLVLNEHMPRMEPTW